MRFRNPSGRCVRGPVAGFAAVAALTCASAWANPPPEPTAGSGRESAVWMPKELHFDYRGFTTKYSCDGLRDRMRNLLLELGARPDLQVRGYGCTQLVGPDPFAGVSIKMNVLQPAGKPGGQAVPARWKTVDVLATDPNDRDPIDAAADCELIGEIRQKVLPLFATRNVDSLPTCEAHRLVPGGTRLKAEVLVVDERAAADSAAQ